MFVGIDKPLSYFLWGSMILIVCLLFVAYMLMTKDNMAALNDMVNINYYFLLLWRLCIYSLLLLALPRIIRRRRRYWSNEQAAKFRRFLFIVIASYELMIVVNPLQVLVSAYWLGGQ